MTTPHIPTLPRSLSQRSITKFKYMHRLMVNKRSIIPILLVIFIYAITISLNKNIYSETSGIANYIASQTSSINTDKLLESVIPNDALNVATLSNLLAGGDANDEISNRNNNHLNADQEAANNKPEPILFQDYVNDYDDDDLRVRLSKRFPYNRDSEIPNYIWQTWSSTLENVKNDKLKKCITSWSHQENYNHFLITDNEVEEIINDFYAEDFPEVIEAYRTLPLNILKYDFFRYLMLYAKGGIYTDIDTLNIVETSKWLDSKDIIESYFGPNITKSDIGLIIGIEGDYDRLDWKYKLSRRLQYVQWTIKSKSGHPVLRELINSIVKLTLNNYSKRLNHVKINDEYFTLLSIYTVLEWTGPGIFTDSVFDHFNKIYGQVKPFELNDGLNYINKNEAPSIKYFEFGEKESLKFTDRNQFDQQNKRIGWNNFTKISKPVLYDDVIILPINSFNGFIDDLEYPVDNKLTYIKHEFNGSWKS